MNNNIHAGDIGFSHRRNYVYVYLEFSPSYTCGNVFQLMITYRQITIIFAKPYDKMLLRAG